MARTRSADHTFDMVNKTRTRAPLLPYSDIKNAILGKRYELSLAYIGKSRARALNKRLRGKDKPANVLSFPLSHTSGEITLCLQTIKQEAPKFGHTFKQHVGFLFIHGLLHLKGLDHSSRMESEERRFMKAYKLA